MHHASAHIVGATVEAARRVWTGEVAARRQHHRRAAPRDARPGQRLLRLQRRRGRRSGGCSTTAREQVAYVDVDVHHGDGVERMFYDDPRVLTISLHETGQMLFPGTGFPDDIGGPGAEGTRGQRGAAAGHLGRRLAARVPRRRARRCCASSPPTSWSPSTGATPTPRTRWRT